MESDTVLEDADAIASVARADMIEGANRDGDAFRR
jgi:hypothetical protein